MQKQNPKDVTISLQTSPASSNRSSVVSNNGSNSSGYSSASSNAVKIGLMTQPSESSLSSSIHQHPPPPPHHFLPFDPHQFHTHIEPHSHGSVSNHGHVITNYPPTFTQYGQQCNERFEDEQLNLQKREVLEWLQSIKMTEKFQFFVKSGYDLVTISRMTPEDLTAIGITNPEARKRISNEITKLRVHDVIPNNWPGSLFYWLEMLHLLEYLDLLTSEGCSTLERLLQVTWEDFEEMKIHKLGHLKKLVLAIDRLKRSKGGELASNRTGSSSNPKNLPYSNIDNYLQLRGVHVHNRQHITHVNNGAGHDIEYVPIHLNRSWSGMLGPQQEEVRPSSLLIRYESFHGNPYNDFKSLVRDQDTILGVDNDSNFSDTTPTNHPTSPPFFRESRSSIVPSPAPLTPLSQGLPPLPTISPQPSPTKSYDSKPRLPPKPKPKPSLQSGLGSRSGQENSVLNANGKSRCEDSSTPNHPRISSPNIASVDLSPSPNHSRIGSPNIASVDLSPSPKRQNANQDLRVSFRRRNNSGNSNKDRMSIKSQTTPPPPPKRTNSIRENLNVVTNEDDNVVISDRTFNQNNEPCGSTDDLGQNTAVTNNSTLGGTRTFYRANCSTGSSTNQNGSVLPATEQRYILENVSISNSQFNESNNHKLSVEPSFPPPLPPNIQNFYLDQINRNISDYREDPNDLDLPYPPPPPIECGALPFANENIATLKQKLVNEQADALPVKLPVLKVSTKPIVPAKPIKQAISNGLNSDGDVSNIFEDIDDMFAGLTEELNSLIAMQK